MRSGFSIIRLHQRVAGSTADLGDFADEDHAGAGIDLIFTAGEWGIGRLSAAFYGISDDWVGDVCHRIYESAIHWDIGALLIVINLPDQTNTARSIYIFS